MMLLALPFALVGIAFIGLSALWAKADIGKHPLPGGAR